MSPQVKIYAPAVVAVLVGFFVAVQFIKPAPPDTVVIASGGETGAYHAFAKAYAQRLRDEGIELKIVNTAGSIENIALLRDSKVDVAFVQGGVEVPQQDETLRSLGSLYFEPLWLFVREGVELKRLNAMTRLKIAVGKPGSGTRALVSRLLADNGVAEQNWSELGGDEAAQALLEGELDAAFFVSSTRSKTIQQLLANERVRAVDFERADAYAKRYRFLTSVELPEGAMDLQKNIPAQPIRLVAPAANLVMHPDLHPAVIDLLLQAATAAHADGEWFEQRGQFPQNDLLAFPLAKEAERYYRHGPPLLQRYLPFWAASLIDRIKVMLLPLVLMLIPLIKVMPPLYTWRMRSRVYRWYEELEHVDLEIARPGFDTQALAAELDRIEDDVREVNVPLSFADQLYHLRQHIDLVRRRLDEAVKAAEGQVQV